MKALIVFVALLCTHIGYSQNYWTGKASLPSSARYAAVGFSIDSSGYICCGQIDNGSYTHDLWAFNPINNTWIQKASLPGPNIYGPSAFVINGIAYVGNGHLINGSNVNEFYGYNPLTNVWTTIASFPGLSRYSCGTFVLNNKGYIVCGTTGNLYLNELWEYDPLTNVWTQKASIPGSGRAHPVCFSLNNFGYVTTGKNNSGSYLNDTWKYNPSTNVWTQIGNIGNVERTAGVGFVLNNKGYCGSGISESGSELCDFWEFDPVTEIWTEIAYIPEGLGRHGASSFAIDNKGFILTGIKSGTCLSDVWEYYPNVGSAAISNNLIDPIIWFPYPSTNIINIFSSRTLDCNVRIFEIGGKLLIDKNITIPNTFNSFLNSKGVYIIQITAKSYSKTSKLLIK
jgi:N-acetylneuraminic acid mutarotase